MTKTTTVTCHDGAYVDDGPNRSVNGILVVDANSPATYARYGKDLFRVVSAGDQIRVEQWGAVTKTWSLVTAHPASLFRVTESPVEFQLWAKNTARGQPVPTGDAQDRLRASTQAFQARAAEIKARSQGRFDKNGVRVGDRTPIRDFEPAQNQAELRAQHQAQVAAQRSRLESINAANKARWAGREARG